MNVMGAHWRLAFVSFLAGVFVCRELTLPPTPKLCHQTGAPYHGGAPYGALQ